LTTDAADAPGKSLGVDGAELFNEHSGGFAADLDLGSKRRGAGTARSGSHEHDRSRKKLIGLHDDTETGSLLFMPDAFG
jgi:hypothetical protein